MLPYKKWLNQFQQQNEKHFMASQTYQCQEIKSVKGSVYLFGVLHPAGEHNRQEDRLCLWPRKAHDQASLLWYWSINGLQTAHCSNVVVLNSRESSWCEGFSGFVFEKAAEQAVQKILFEPYILKLVVTINIDTWAVRAPVRIFVKNYVEQYSLERGKMEHSYHWNITTVDIMPTNRPGKAQAGRRALARISPMYPI